MISATAARDEALQYYSRHQVLKLQEVIEYIDKYIKPAVENSIRAGLMKTSISLQSPVSRFHDVREVLGKLGYNLYDLKELSSGGISFTISW